MFAQERVWYSDALRTRTGWVPGELSVWSLAVEGPSGDITDGWGLSTLLNRRILNFSPGAVN